MAMQAVVPMQVRHLLKLLNGLNPMAVIHASLSMKSPAADFDREEATLNSSLHCAVVVNQMDQAVSVVLTNVCSSGPDVDDDVVPHVPQVMHFDAPLSTDPNVILAAAEAQQLAPAEPIL
jgi:hypothetical protein